MEDYVSPPFKKVGVFRGRFIREGEAMPDPTNLTEVIGDLAVLRGDIASLKESVSKLQQSSGWWAGLETWLSNHPGIAHTLNALFVSATTFAITYMATHTPAQPALTPQVQVKPDESPKGSVKDGKGP